MSFHDKSIGESVASDDDASARKVDRDSILMKAGLILEDGAEPIDVRIRNLSAGGLMAEPTLKVENGQRVAVELRNIGKISGRIAWANDRQFGVAFDKPIDPKMARRPIGTSDYERPATLRKVTHDGRPGIRSY